MLINKTISVYLCYKVSIINSFTLINNIYILASKLSYKYKAQYKLLQCLKYIPRDIKANTYSDLN